EARHHRPGGIFLQNKRPGVEQETPERLRQMKPVLLDTGVIVALLDRSEQYHAACVEVVADSDAPLVTCEAVIAEACYLLRQMKGANQAVLENVARGGFQIGFWLSEEPSSLKRIQAEDSDREIDLADACLIQMADEFETGAILTLDQDFRVYRWGRNKPFELRVPLN